jgi:hypothetical protein
VKHLALKACKGNELVNHDLLGENLVTYSTKTKIYGWNRSQLFLRTTAGFFVKNKLMHNGSGTQGVPASLYVNITKGENNGEGIQKSLPLLCRQLIKAQHERRILMTGPNTVL